MVVDPFTGVGGSCQGSYSYLARSETLATAWPQPGSQISLSRNSSPYGIRRDKKKAFANRECVKTTRVCMDDGHPANSVVTEKLIFREHFGAKLAGTVLPFKALLDKDRVDSSNVFCEVNCAVGDSRMPSRMQRAVPFLCSFQQRCVWGKQPPKLHCSPFPTFLCPPLFLPCSQVLLSCCPTPPAMERWNSS